MKIWKFYFCFNEDAMLLNKILDFKIRKRGKSICVFFHESTKLKVERKLIEANHKVVVVE